MDELILQPNESIILKPGEAIYAQPDTPLKIRVGEPEVTPSAFDNAEEMLWSTLKRATGNQTAIYRRGDDSRLVYIVPETARPDSFGYDDHVLTTRSRIFKIGLSDLDKLFPPQHGDTLEYNEKIYEVKMTSNADGTFYQNVGSGLVMVRIHVTEYEE